MVATFFLNALNSAEAQQPPTKMPRIGYLIGASFMPDRNEALLQGLRELGYMEGKTIVIEWRSAEGKLDRLTIRERPLDVLSQQVAAEVAAEDWSVDELFELVRRAYPYRHLERAEFDEVVAMLTRGFETRRGRRGALLHHDAVHGRLRGRRGARMTAITSGGAIPDNADYRVVLEPDTEQVSGVPLKWNETLLVPEAAPAGPAPTTGASPAATAPATSVRRSRMATTRRSARR